MVTVLENPVDEPLNISLSVTDGTWEKYIIQPKQQLIIRTNISHLKNKMKVTLKGDRRTILIKDYNKENPKVTSVQCCFLKERFLYLIIYKAGYLPMNL